MFHNSLPQCGKKDFHRYFFNVYEYTKDFKNPEIDLFEECTRGRLGNLHCVEVNYPSIIWIPWHTSILNPQELFSKMRGWIYYYISALRSNQESPLGNNLAVDVSFGSVGFARVLARPFKKVKVHAWLEVRGISGLLHHILKPCAHPHIETLQLCPAAFDHARVSLINFIIASATWLAAIIAVSDYTNN